MSPAGSCLAGSSGEQLWFPTACPSLAGSNWTLTSKSKDKSGVAKERKPSCAATSLQLCSIASPWSFEHSQTTQADQGWKEGWQRDSEAVSTPKTGTGALSSTNRMGKLLQYMEEVTPEFAWNQHHAIPLWVSKNQPRLTFLSVIVALSWSPAACGSNTHWMLPPKRSWFDCVFGKKQTEPEFSKLSDFFIITDKFQLEFQAKITES